MGTLRSWAEGSSAAVQITLGTGGRGQASEKTLKAADIVKTKIKTKGDTQGVC